MATSRPLQNRRVLTKREEGLVRSFCFLRLRRRVTGSQLIQTLPFLPRAKHGDGSNPPVDHLASGARKAPWRDTPPRSSPRGATTAQARSPRTWYGDESTQIAFSSSNSSDGPRLPPPPLLCCFALRSFDTLLPISFVGWSLWLTSCVWIMLVVNSFLVLPPPVV